MRAPTRFLALVLACGVLAAACGPAVDLKKNLEVETVSTGWFDAGIVDGKNKLVPTVSFRLKNLSDQKLTVLQVNALFRRVAENDEWGSGLVTVAGSDGPGGWRYLRRPHDQVAAGLHGHRITRRHAEELPVRRRQGQPVRQVRLGPVDANRRRAHHAAVPPQMTSSRCA